jgi:hypothetical protein
VTADGRLYSVTTGGYLALEFIDGNSASTLKEPLSAACPEPTVKKPGSGRSPGTLENEKLPLAMRWCYSSLNYGYAASTAIGDAVSMRF